MPDPVLSLIVPVYNHGQSLPRLLQSIAGQSMAAHVEVLIIDDCSSENIASVVQEFTGKGLAALRHIPLKKRCYTKQARVIGMEQASGAVIGFADADDIIWGRDALENNVNLALQKGADIVHFPTVLLNADYVFLGEYVQARPYADLLQGRAIFSALVKARVQAVNIWSKLYSRKLVQAVLEPARCSSIRRYREDVLFAILFFFHAELYLGSPYAAYGYRKENKDSIKAPGRIASNHAMLQELVPYLRQHGCAAEEVNSIAGGLRRFYEKNMKLFWSCLGKQEPRVSRDTLHGLLQHAPLEDWFDILYTEAGREAKK